MPKWFNLANLFTLARLILAPFVITAILRRHHGQALALFAAAAVTDALDGALARRYGWTTKAGAYIDPVADKALLSGAYLALAVIGSIVFLAMGFGVAGWAKNENQAAPVANLISLPMMFLSGSFFPREAMPEFLQTVTRFLPLTYLNDALRAVINDGSGLDVIGTDIFGLAVWAVISFVIATRLFKWE